MLRKINIGGKLIGNGEPPFIIAEGGINHNGDLSLAKEMIKSASDAGADAIKFQTHFADKEMVESSITARYIGESVYHLIGRMELSKDDHIELIECAKKHGIIFLSTPFSKEAVDLLCELDVPAFKIGSGELTNLPLVEYIARKNKPVILSTGMSTMDEIAEAVNLIKTYNKKLILMQCTSIYPTRYEDVNLGAMKILRDVFNVPVGLSDHSECIYTALGAVALGACVIEKHFTLSRKLDGPDQKASIEPPELVELVKGSNAIFKATGDCKEVIQEEVQVQQFARESVVSLVDIKKGEMIRQDMVWVKRPGTGIPARCLNSVLGRVVNKDINKNNILQWSDLA